MPGRNGSTLRLVGASFCILIIIYLIYTNQTIHTKLKDTELLAERFKRSQSALSIQLKECSESTIHTKLKDTELLAERFKRSQSALSIQLKDLVAVKTEQETRHANDKDAMQGKYNALSRDFKLLQDKKEELTQQYETLMAETNKANEEHINTARQREEEYKMYKRTQEGTITNLHESIENLQREKTKYASDMQQCRASLDTLQQEHGNLQQNLRSVHQELSDVKVQHAADIEKRSAELVAAQKLAQAQNIPQNGQENVQKIHDTQNLNNQQQNIQQNVAQTPAPQNVVHHNIPVQNQALENHGVQNQGLQNAVNVQNQGNNGVLEHVANQGLGVGQAANKIADLADQFAAHDAGQAPVKHDEEVQVQQIKPPDKGDHNMAYKKQEDKVVPPAADVQNDLRQAFEQDQQLNAQIQMPKIGVNHNANVPNFVGDHPVPDLKAADHDNNVDGVDNLKFEPKEEKPLQVQPPQHGLNNMERDEDDNVEKENDGGDQPMVMPKNPMNVPDDFERDLNGMDEDEEDEEDRKEKNNLDSEDKEENDKYDDE